MIAILRAANGAGFRVLRYSPRSDREIGMAIARAFRDDPPASPLGFARMAAAAEYRETITEILIQ